MADKKNKYLRQLKESDFKDAYLVKPRPEILINIVSGVEGYYHSDNARTITVKTLSGRLYFAPREEWMTLADYRRHN